MKELETSRAKVRVLRFLAPLHFVNAGRFVDKLSKELEKEEKREVCRQLVDVPGPARW